MEITLPGQHSRNRKRYTSAHRPEGGAIDLLKLGRRFFTYGFSVRVLPTHAFLMQAHELRLISWS